MSSGDREQYPTQVKDYDCGIFVIQYAERLVKQRTAKCDALVPSDFLDRDWPNMDHARLKLWMDLPKTCRDWPLVPPILRDANPYQSTYLRS